MRRQRWWLAVAVLALAGCMAARGGHGGGSAASGSASPGAKPTATGSPSAGAPSPGVDADPARYAPQVRRHAAAAGVDARLLMAILYNESYKPHDPAFERAWQRLKGDAAFGVANMHQATFDEVKQGRDFASRSWDELPDDPGLAIEAAAWYLRDLRADLPARRSASYSVDELLALGYNAGPANMRAFARGVRPGPAAQSYLDRLRENWAAAGRALAAGTGQPS